MNVNANNCNAKPVYIWRSARAQDWIKHNAQAWENIGFSEALNQYPYAPPQDTSAKQAYWEGYRRGELARLRK